MTDDIDAESVDLTPPPPGPPVDPPDRPPTFAAVVHRAEDRRPIVPAALRSRQQRAALYRWALRFGAHTTAYHVTRAPKYAAKVAAYAPVGAGRLLWWLCRWAWDAENWQVRQAAVERQDAEAYLRLVRERNQHVRLRLVAVAAGGLLALAAAVWLGVWAPRWGQAAVLAALVVALARLGRPADRPITDRVTASGGYRKLTAEAVRRALASLGVAGINQALAKDPAAITFPREISRDGPGYLAVVDLPYGVEAVDVIERRGRLASGLRCTLDQVWPETVPGQHAGRLSLWVGDEPASAMRQPVWPLLKRGQVDVFKPFPFATDPRLRPVQAGLMWRNWLVGAMPGAGKTFTLRLLLLAAALDPRVELRGYELKGSGDLDAVEPLCAEYGSGADDDTAEAAYRMLAGLLAECQRRGPVVKRMAKAGKAPENKVTPELAGMDGLGLHPVVAFIDECQELFAHPEYGQAAGDVATRVIKLGRALGVVLLLATQRPDAKSLPTGVSANVNTRFALRVMGQLENDLILGTSMYKNGVRATQFGDRDLGWGWLVGVGDPVACRSYYVDGPAAAAVAARARALREAAGTLPAEREHDRVPAYNLLDDVRAVWVDGEDALWSELIVPRLARLRPDVYGDWDVKTFGAAMRAAGVRTVSVHRKIDGKGVTRYGVDLATLDAAIKKTAITSR